MRINWLSNSQPWRNTQKPPVFRIHLVAFCILVPADNDGLDPVCKPKRTFPTTMASAQLTAWGPFEVYNNQRYQAQCHTGEVMMVMDEEIWLLVFFQIRSSWTFFSHVFWFFNLIFSFFLKLKLCVKPLRRPGPWLSPRVLKHRRPQGRPSGRSSTWQHRSGARWYRPAADRANDGWLGNGWHMTYDLGRGLQPLGS